MEVDTPWQWSAEAPVLYTVVLRLIRKGQETILASRCGFRTFEMKDGLMMLNNKRIIFKGTNRHEFGAEFGRAITKEAMLADVLAMKRNNINAVPPIIPTILTGMSCVTNTDSTLSMKPIWKPMEHGHTAFLRISSRMCFREAIPSGQERYWTAWRICITGTETIPVC